MQGSNAGIPAAVSQHHFGVAKRRLQSQRLESVFDALLGPTASHKCGGGPCEIMPKIPSGGNLHLVDHIPISHQGQVDA